MVTSSSSEEARYVAAGANKWAGMVIVAIDSERRAAETRVIEELRLLARTRRGEPTRFEPPLTGRIRIVASGWLHFQVISLKCSYFTTNVLMNQKC